MGPRPDGSGRPWAWLGRWHWHSVAVLVIVGALCLEFWLLDPEIKRSVPWPFSFAGFVLAHLFPLRKTR